MGHKDFRRRKATIGFFSGSSSRDILLNMLIQRHAEAFLRIIDNSTVPSHSAVTLAYISKVMNLRISVNAL